MGLEREMACGAARGGGGKRGGMLTACGWIWMPGWGLESEAACRYTGKRWEGVCKEQPRGPSCMHAYPPARTPTTHQLCRRLQIVAVDAGVQEKLHGNQRLVPPAKPAHASLNLPAPPFCGVLSGGWRALPGRRAPFMSQLCLGEWGQKLHATRQRKSSSQRPSVPGNHSCSSPGACRSAAQRASKRAQAGRGARRLTWQRTPATKGLGAAREQAVGGVEWGLKSDDQVQAALPIRIASASRRGHAPIPWPGWPVGNALSPASSRSHS